MPTRQRKRSILRRLMLPVAIIAWLAYFSWHAFHGDHGIFARQRLEQRVAQLEGELAELEAQREGLKHRIALLRPESLDPDMIEEQARILLNLVHPDEITVFLPARPHAN